MNKSLVGFWLAICVCKVSAIRGLALGAMAFGPDGTPQGALLSVVLVEAFLAKAPHSGHFKLGTLALPKRC